MSKSRTASFKISQQDHEWLYIFAQAAICHAGVRLNREASNSPYEIVLEVDEDKFLADTAGLKSHDINLESTFRAAVEKMQDDLQIMAESGFHCSKAVIPDLTC